MVILFVKTFMIIVKNSILLRNRLYETGTTRRERLLINNQCGCNCLLLIFYITLITIVPSYDNKFVKFYELNLIIIIEYFFIIYFVIQILKMHFLIILIIIYFYIFSHIKIVRARGAKTCTLKF